ncbi:MAG TPA: 30S ribosomal protein S16 [Acidobacteriota bacterium]|nr:30S ribosomal protein S16 [Acidobacteriota bacterium]
MLRIRLSRHGAKKNPHYRVVVSEKSDPRDGRFVEIVGNYSPAMKPKRLKLNMERIEYWIGVGARPSQTVSGLIEKARTAQAEAEAEAKAEAPAEKADSTEKDSKAKESAKEEKKEAKAAGKEESEPEPQEEAESEADKEAAEA